MSLADSFKRRLDNFSSSPDLGISQLTTEIEIPILGNKKILNLQEILDLGTTVWFSANAGILFNDRDTIEARAQWRMTEERFSFGMKYSQLVPKTRTAYFNHNLNLINLERGPDRWERYALIEYLAGFPSGTIDTKLYDDGAGTAATAPDGSTEVTEFLKYAAANQIRLLLDAVIVNGTETIVINGPESTNDQ